MYVIDRRLNPSGKSLPNRQRFLRRAGKILREAVRNVSSSRPIREVGEAGVVIIPARGIDEPSFHTGSDGKHARVLPGNKEFLEGDRIARQGGSGSGKGKGSGSQAGNGGGGEDEFKVALSAEEFLNLFLEDLELPDLERRKLSLTDSTGMRRAGYQRGGSPANLAISRTMRNALSRRMALRRPKPEDVERARQAAEEAQDDTESSDALRAEFEALEQRTKAIPYIDPIDIRYRRFEPSPRPIAQAVMVCVMDVSGSMTEHMKDIAKRFFMLLYVFLERRYKQVEIVFIRHTDEAKEVDEKTFFESRETGGTRVSSALAETLRVLEERYPVADWNIYVAQASDGDNESGDSERSTILMREGLLPMCQYFAYLEVDEPHNESPMSTLWKTYDNLDPGPSMRRVTTRQEIYPVFRELFRRRAPGEVETT